MYAAGSNWKTQRHKRVSYGLFNSKTPHHINNECTSNGWQVKPERQTIEKYPYLNWQIINQNFITLIHWLQCKAMPGRFTSPEGLPWRSKTKLANTGNVMWLWCVSRIVWPGGGSVWRGFPAVGDTLTLPACVGPGLPRHHSCDRAQPHRCSPEGSMAHTHMGLDYREYMSEMHFAAYFKYDRNVTDLCIHTKKQLLKPWISYKQIGGCRCWPFGSY